MKYTVLSVLSTSLLFSAAVARAQEAGKAPLAPESTDVVQENILALCQDGVDNDKDAFIDCDDQDCQIYAVCVGQAPVPVVVEPPPPLPESGWQCKDGKDNDENGLTDCHDKLCRHTSYCRRLMYERPEPKNKAPGFFLNFGFGVALPNYRIPTAETDGGSYDEVPFDPDFGLMLDLQAGYLFLKFLGAGVNFKSAFTYATNRDEYYLTRDDPDDYKYTGSKYYGNMGAFVRLQWPFPRIVPYLNIHVGYSVATYRWHIYDARNNWDDIYDYESNYSDFIRGEVDEPTIERTRHFTFALEPGFDVIAVRRLFGVGVRGWLPVVANKDASYDNIGILLNFSFYPMWRERPRLKPEYQTKKR